MIGTIVFDKENPTGCTKMNLTSTAPVDRTDSMTETYKGNE